MSQPVERHLRVVPPEEVWLRCSSLPLIMTCAGSLERPKVKVREVNDAATVGTVAHHLLERLPREGSVDFEAIPALAAQYGLEESDLSVLCALGTRMWRKLEGTFAGADTEPALHAEIADGVHLTGHADGLRIYGSVAHGWDWKTGYADSDYSQQMLGYCALVLLTHPEVERVSFSVLWVRDNDIEGYSMRRSELADWVDGVVRQAREWDGTLYSGRHCLYCPRQHECAGYESMARRALAPFLQSEIVDSVDSLAGIPESDQVDLFQQAALVESLAQRARQMIRDSAIKSGGLKGNGYELDVSRQRKRELKPAEAWPVLQEALTDEELPSVIKVRLGEVEKLVASKAPRGSGSAAKRALAAQLDEADAIAYSETIRVSVRRRTKE